MTVVEFYSTDPIENVASLAALRPERVIVLCGEPLSEDKETRYRNFATDVAPMTALEFRVWDMRDTAAMEDTLAALCAEADVRLDLTGGDETALWVAGRLSARLSVRMHRFDLMTGKAYVVPSGERLPLEKPLTMTVPQYVALHGGTTGASANGRPLREWTLTPELESAVKNVWSACVERGEQWNNDMRDFLRRLSHRLATTDPLEVRMDDEAPAVKGKSTQRRDRFLECLDRHNVIQHRRAGCFRYVSQEVKECLGKEGNALELYTLVTAMTLKDDNGDPLFCDARNGVYIDWNGQFCEAGNAHNEVDVMLMSGVRPVFISCKSGDIEREETFMLRSLADRFGGKRAVTALVASDGLTASFVNRVEQMNIRLLQQADRTDLPTFEATLRDWLNKT